MQDHDVPGVNVREELTRVALHAALVARMLVRTERASVAGRAVEMVVDAFGDPEEFGVAVDHDPTGVDADTSDVREQGLQQLRDPTTRRGRVDVDHPPAVKQRARAAARASNNSARSAPMSCSRRRGSSAGTLTSRTSGPLQRRRGSTSPGAGRSELYRVVRARRGSSMKRGELRGVRHDAESRSCRVQLASCPLLGRGHVPSLRLALRTLGLTRKATARGNGRARGARCGRVQSHEFCSPRRYRATAVASSRPNPPGFCSPPRTMRRSSVDTDLAMPPNDARVHPAVAENPQ